MRLCLLNLLIGDFGSVVCYSDFLARSVPIFITVLDRNEIDPSAAVRHLNVLGLRARLAGRARGGRETVGGRAQSGVRPRYRYVCVWVICMHARTNATWVRRWSDSSLHLQRHNVACLYLVFFSP